MNSDELKRYLKNLPGLIDQEGAQIRKQNATKSFLNFVQTYFLAHVANAAGEFKESSKFRRDFYENEFKWTSANRNILIKAYRGAAKTTLVSRLWVLYKTLAKFSAQNIVIISATIGLSKKTLDFIKNELEENELLIKDFHIIKGEKWSEEEIIFYAGKFAFKISAYGAGKKIRGENWRGHRPNLIICDDLENDENVRTKSQRDKIYDWFEKAVMKLPARGDEKHNIVVVGTTLHHDSLLKRLELREDFFTLNYPLVRAFPSNLDDEKWNMREFILDDATLNKAKFKAEFLSAKKAFMSEYQNEPLSSDEAIFSGYKTYEIMPLCDAYYIGIDPAMGKARGDYFGLAVLGRKENQYYLDTKGYKIKPDLMIEKIMRLYLNLAKFARPIKIAVETIAFQEFFKDELKKAFANRGIILSVCELKNSVVKELRLDAFAPYITGGEILINQANALLCEELDTYPKSAHDDLLDASEMAFRIASRAAIADYRALNRLASRNDNLIKSIKGKYL